MRQSQGSVIFVFLAGLLSSACTSSDSGTAGSGGAAGAGGTAGTSGMGGTVSDGNCVADGLCREGERCTCRECWILDSCSFNACNEDGECSEDEGCTCIDCEGAPECESYCVPCSEFLRQLTLAPPNGPAFPPTDSLCDDSVALYAAFEQCACDESCADECGDTLCTEAPPSAACFACYTANCMDERDACGLAVRPDNLCNPVTGEPCLEGETCDRVQPVIGTIAGFFCFQDPAERVLCETCNTDTGPFCQNTLTCVEDDGSVSAGNGECARYCCTDDDCGTGTCVKGAYAPAAPDLGVCADDMSMIPACDVPDMPTSGGSCVPSP